MKQQLYINNVVFRILFPVFSGLVLYLALLMVFGSLDQLGESFLSQEAFFLVLLTYINHEWAVFRMRKGQGQEIFSSGKPLRLVIYLSTMLSVTILITSVITLVYFLLIIGYAYFLTEIITLNILLILFQMLVQLYYIGIIQSRHLHELNMVEEENHNKRLELELESFKNEMNPSLLMSCLETMISLIHEDVQAADRYIKHLSDHYRYLLDNRQREFVEMDLETNAAGELVNLLSSVQDKSLSLDCGEHQQYRGIYIIPGTLSYLVLYIVNNMIINSLSPMIIKISLDKDKQVLVTCENRPRLVPADEQPGKIDRLDNSYRHYTGIGIEVSRKDDRITWKVPHIPDIKED